MNALHVSLAFCVALVGSVAAQMWLHSRQVRHVARHRAQVPAPFDTTVTLQAHQRAADYTIARSRLSLMQRAMAAGVLLAWTLLGGLDALNNAVATWAFQALGTLGYQVVLLAAFVAIGWVLEAPWDLYSTFGLEQRFGFNRTTLRMWASDQVKSGLVGAALGLPLAALVLWIMGTAGPRWWLWAWGAWMAFNLVLLVIYPTLIAPLFNRFEPLGDPALAQRVQGLMTRCGFAAKGLFVMDGSRRSAHANAYFTGLGRAKRVVFYDTLLARLSPQEVEAVLAHELGHFHHRHILKRVLVLFTLGGAALAVLGWLSQQSSFYLGLGVHPNLALPNDALALLLFGLAVPPFAFFLAPLLAHMSRRDEFEADAYARSQASAQDLASALLKLHEDNAATLTPDPLFVRFHYSHPPASQRLSALQAEPASALPA